MVEQGGELHLLIIPGCFPHASQPLGHTFPALCRVRVRLTSVLLDQRPSLRTLRQRFPVLFEWFLGNMPLCDSSGTYMRAVWLLPSPAGLPPGLTAGVREVSRFSCMKFLGVSGVFDYAGLNKDSRYRPCSCCLPRISTASASGLYVFAAQLPTPPIPLSTLHWVPHGSSARLGAERIANPFP
jgi:hypothetical protein